MVSAASATINTRPVRRGISLHWKPDPCHPGTPLHPYIQDTTVTAAMFFSPGLYRNIAPPPVRAAIDCSGRWLFVPG
jgi:hypothetical protein